MATSETPAPMYGLHDFQRDLVHVVALLGPAKGQDLKRELQRLYSTDINHGRLYPNLDELADMGLIKKTDGVDNRSNSYEITERGRRDLEAQLKFTEMALA